VLRVQVPSGPPRTTTSLSIFMIWIQLILLSIGLLVIAKGGDLFVDASIDISRIFHIPRIIVGGTIVSIATTTPELVVSATSSVMGDSGIAIGNAVGSVIANIGLIVGTVCLLTNVSVDTGEFRRRAGWMIAASLVMIMLTWDRQLPRLFAVLLLLISVAYLCWDLWSVAGRSRQKQTGGESLEVSAQSAFVRFIIGIVAIVIGSRMLVASGIEIAQALGVPSAIIGLSIIAIGTSLPELVTGVSSAAKGVPDLSIGNIVGANILNISMIVGVAGLIRPLEIVPFTQSFSFPFMLFFVVLMSLFFFSSSSTSRIKGVILIAAYVIYLIGLACFKILI